MSDEVVAAEGRGTGSSVGELARAGVLLSAMYLAARILGYVRVVVLAAQFGAGPELDAFYTAFRIPDLIFQLSAAGALASALVPAFAALHAEGADARMWRVLSRVTTLVLVALAGLSLVAFVFADPLCALIAPGFDPEVLRLTTDLTRAMLLAPVFLSAGAIATAALNSRRAFGAAAVAPVLYNVAIIGGALVLGPSMGVAGVAWGVVAGSAAHTLVQIPALWRMGFRFQRMPAAGDPLVRETLTLAGPRILGLGAMQLMFAAMISIASALPAGAVTAWSVAYSLLQVPLGVVGVPLGVVIFPSLSAAKAVGQTDEYVALIDRALRLVLFAMVPITVLAMVLREPIVNVLLGHGRYTTEDVAATAATLLPLLVALPAQAAVAVLARAFYARRNTRTPVSAAVLGVAFDIGTALVASAAMGLPGIGVGIAIGAWAEAVVLFVALGRVEPTLSAGSILRSGPRIAIAGVVAGVAAGVTLGAVDAALGAGAAGTIGSAVAATAGVAVGGLAYLGGAFAFGLREPGQLLALVARRRARSAA